MTLFQKRKQELEATLKKSGNWRLYVLCAAAVSVLIALGVSFALHTDSPPKSSPAPQEQQAQQSPPEPQITLQQAAEALKRWAAHSDKICYDPGRNGWYMHWPSDNDPDNHFFVDWLYTDSPQFYYIGKNNSWYITDIQNSKFARVYPVVDGLDCFP